MTRNAWTEQMVRDSFKLMGALDRELYLEHLAIAKDQLGLPADARSLEAANMAITRTINNRRIRREKRWPYAGETWEQAI